MARRVFLERLNRKHAQWHFHDASNWFEQGYEEYLGVMLSTEHNRTVTLEKYKDLVRRDPHRVGYFGVTNDYSDGAVLMLFLHEEFGKGKVHAVLLSKAPSFAQAMAKELGVDPEQLAKRWNGWRRKRLGPQNSPR
jgi:hypothetical protein